MLTDGNLHSCAASDHVTDSVKMKGPLQRCSKHDLLICDDEFAQLRLIACMQRSKHAQLVG